MAFNRIVDARYDAMNPRTRERAIPSGQVSVSSYWAFLILSSVLFVFSAWMLNKLAFYLSPVALIQGNLSKSTFPPAIVTPIFLPRNKSGFFRIAADGTAQIGGVNPNQHDYIQD